MRKTFIILLLICLTVTAFPLAASSKEPADLKIVVFGDSISAAGVWEQWFEGHTGAKVINRGVGGDSTETAKSRFSDILSLSPDIVFIEFGSNDSAIDMSKYVPLDKFKDNLYYYAEALKKSGAHFIFITPPPIDDKIYLTRHEEAPFLPYGGPNGLVTLYAEAVREVALTLGAPIADVNRDFNALDDYKKYLADGLHPNSQGYSVYTWACINTWRRMWLGDVNADFSVTARDYALVKRHCLGTYELSSAEAERADVSGSGKVDPRDYMILKRTVLGTYVLD